jgi:hypothetical protein
MYRNHIVSLFLKASSQRFYFFRVEVSCDFCPDFSFSSVTHPVRIWHRWERSGGQKGYWTRPPDDFPEANKSPTASGVLAFFPW